MGLVLQVFLSGILAVILWKLSVWATAWARRRGKPLPGPPRHWLFGNTLQVAAVVKSGQHFDALARELAQQYGKIFSLGLLAYDFVIVTDPEALKEILVTKNYPKSPTYKFLFPFIGSESMVVAKHEVWRRQRAAYNPAFSYAFLRTLVPTVFASRAMALVRRLRQAARANETVKLLDLLKMVTLDVVAQVALNKDYHFMDYSDEPPLIYKYFVDLLDSTALYASRPDLRYQRYLPWVARRLKRKQRAFDDIILETIRERIAAIPAPVAAPTALPSTGGSSASAPKAVPSGRIGALSGTPREASVAFQERGVVGAATTAEAQQETKGTADAGMAWSHELEASSTSPPVLSVAGGYEGVHDILSMALRSARLENDKLNENEVLSQVKSFLFAGHDTTSSTVAFAVYELCLHPDMEEGVVAELKAEGCLDRALNGQLTSEDLNTLKFLGAVIKETLRMWPPAGTARMAPPGSTLQGYDIGGKVLYIPQSILHRDKDLWGDTADEFRPERWSDSAYIARLHPYAYQPFSKGPRDCIGQTFALLEAKSLLASICAHFSFKYMGAEPEQQGYKITSFPKFHVPVTVTERQHVV